MKKQLLGVLLVVSALIYFAHMGKLKLPHSLKFPSAAASASGYVNPTDCRSPWRIDQGVDYNGPCNLYAMGSGTIVNLYDSGWPGGGYIKLLLDSGAYKGRYVYYAEQIVPVVGLGHVKTGQLIARCDPVKACMEVGWAETSGDNTMAYQLGQSAPGLAHGDPGFYPTACGVNFSNLIKSLGGTPGLMENSPVQGSSC